MNYKHLTPEKRERIAVLNEQGQSMTKIAQEIGCSKSTVSREFTRNGGRRGYSGLCAQQHYLEQRKHCHMQHRLFNFELHSQVQKHLALHWSPEQIVGRLKLNVSVTTIYRAFKSGQLAPGLKIHLRRKGKKYSRRGIEKRGHIPDAVSITQRPAEANLRKRIGDFEGDTVLGAQGTGCVATYVDRYSRFLVAIKLTDKQAEALAWATAATLKAFPCHTITLDNGKEFAAHKIIARELGASVFFAHPHSPGERGTNENTNGLLREFIPKGQNMLSLTQETLDGYVRAINSRPRKVLGFRTPYEVFHKTVALGLTI